MRLEFSSGWQVAQDPFDLGEKYEFYKDLYDLEGFAVGSGGTPFQMDEWRELPMLGHLQTLLSEDPHYGAEMRLYNAAPWWYRKTFDLTTEQARKSAALRFEGVDYYCKVWLNGEFLGGHEGYATPFEFDTSGLLKERNVLMVKVWSPLDFDRIAEEPGDPRCLHVIRRMMKGTYEHGDSLIHRDRNPVGIWRGVSLTLFDGLRALSPRVDVVPDGNHARVHVAVAVENAGGEREIPAVLAIRCATTAEPALKTDGRFALKPGRNEIVFDAVLENPRRWNTWDRGGAFLYEACVRAEGLEPLTARFGVREVGLKRTESETSFYINGARQYIRGASYYPETYLSTMSEGRYRRDLEAFVRCGCNMVRVHVHKEKPEFYDLCDEMGIAVMQDTDFNWVHPCDEDWTRRALKIVEDEERELHNHPSILSWVCLNEPVEPHTPEMGCKAQNNRYVYGQPGPQIHALLSEKAPGCALIRGSFCEDDPLSGDSHNYHGSIYGPEDYDRVDGMTEKFNTEFGFDAPPYKESLWNERRIFRRLNLTDERLREIQYYQYRYLKHLIEHYRLMKYAPTSGHMQFMLIDCSPSTFYGVLDYGGCAKPGIRAFYESNQPLGVFLKRGEGRQELWVVNDLLERFDGCTLRCLALDEGGAEIASERIGLDLAPDSLARAGELRLQSPGRVSVRLTLTDASGRVIALNDYDDALRDPAHPSGHPGHFSHTYGLRLY